MQRSSRRRRNSQSDGDFSLHASRWGLTRVTASMHDDLEKTRVSAAVAAKHGDTSTTDYIFLQQSKGKETALDGLTFTVSSGRVTFLLHVAKL